MAVDPGTGEIEAALVTGIRKVRHAVAANAARESKQILDVLGVCGRVRPACSDVGPLQFCPALAEGSSYDRLWDRPKYLLVENSLPFRQARCRHRRVREAGNAVLTDALARDA
jgi:hypothetical protein